MLARLAQFEHIAPHLLLAVMDVQCVHAYMRYERKEKKRILK